MSHAVELVAPAASRPIPARGWLMVATIAALGLGLVPWGATAAAVDPELALLLRFMALIKGAMAAAAVGLVYWRLGYASSAMQQAVYGLSAAGMAGATGLIFNLDHVVAGAVLFHAGLIVFTVMALYDDGGRAALGASMAARRARFRGR